MKLREVPVRVWIVTVWVGLWIFIPLRDAPWYVNLGFAALFLPLYWQVYLKRDFVKED